MERQQKVLWAEEFKEKIESSESAVVINISSLTSNQLNDIRAFFRESGAKCVLVRNNLVQKAISESSADYKSFADMCSGSQTLVCFDAIAPVYDLISRYQEFGFEDKNDIAARFSVKGGICSGEYMDSGYLQDIASMGDINSVRQRLLGAILSINSRTVSVIRATYGSLVNIIDIRFQKK